MATKLYLHAATSTLVGTLPSSEQSTLTADANLFTGEDGTANRTMNTSIGASQANLTNASTADSNAHNYYIARWVSPELFQGNITAQTWTVEYAAKESNAAANFPRSSTGAMYVNCYVWRPSTGTKVGTILDGNSNTDGEEAGTSQTVISFTFAGAAVTGMKAGDVIIFEAWAQVTQGNASSRTQDFYYDGTTENSTSNEAAFISTPEDLIFANTDGNMTMIAASHSSVTSTANTTHFLPVVGDMNFSSGLETTEANTEIKIRQAGTLSKLFTRLTANGITGNTVFTVRKNGSDTGLTVTYGSSATGIKEDLTNTVSVAAGDRICLKAVPGGATGTFTIKLLSLHFTADSYETVTIYGGALTNTLTSASTTRYMPINGKSTSTTTEATAKVKQRAAGTYSKLYVYVSANARTTDTTFKSRKNGSDGNLTVTYASGETGIKEDTTHSDIVAVDDDYNIAVTTGTGTDTMTYKLYKVEFNSTEFKSALISGNGGASSGDQNANLTRYYSVPGICSGVSGETDYRRKIRNARLVLKELHVYLSANTVTAASTATLRINGAATALTTTLTASTTGWFSDTSHTVEVGSGDEITIEIVTGATGTSMRVEQILIYYETGRISKSNTLKWNIIGRISKALTLKWDILTRISKSLILKWNNIARVSKSLILKWDLLGRISKDLILKWNLIGRISKSLILKWDIVGRISKSLILKWDIIGRINKSLTLKWDIEEGLERVSKALILKWNIIGRVSKSLILKWDILGRVSNALILKWNIIGRISKELILKWNIIGRISKELILKWNLLARVEKSLTLKWNVLLLVSKSLTLKWNLLGRISKQLSLKWNIDARVSKSLILKWNIIGRISKELILKWNLNSRLSKTLVLKWNVLGRVSKELSLKWNTIGRISKSLTLKWNIIERVSKAVILKWHILGRVSKQLTLLWNIAEGELERISKTLILKWNIQGRVSKSLILKWDILNRISKSITLKWHILSRVSKTLIIKWNLLNLVSKTLILKWDLVGRVSKSLTLRWNIVGRVSKSLILKWHLVIRVSKSLTLKWDILNRVSKSLTLKWNILARITKSLILKWNLEPNQSTRTGKFNPYPEGKPTPTKLERIFESWKSPWYREPKPRKTRPSRFKRG